jgi:hypothetical protein
MPVDVASSRRPSCEPVGVPRRFAVGTLLVIVTMYSVLFALLTSLGASPVVFGIVAIFFTGVGVGQVVFFKGARPRDASYLTGILLCPAMLLAAFLADRLFGFSELSPEHVGIETVPQLLSAMFYLAIVGVPLGYVAGCAAAGVFFVMDRIQRFRRRFGPQADGPSPSSADRVVGEERPALDERLWLRLRQTVAGLSPRQKGRPVREAVSVFVVVGALLGAAAPFLPWAWWVHALASVVTALIVTFLRTGGHLCGWKGGLMLLLLGAVGAIGPGVLLSRISLFPGGHVPDHAFLVLAVIAGGLIGLLVSAGLGWARWLLEGSNSTRRRGKATRRVGMITALCVILVYGALSLWLFQVSQRPRQRTIALVEGLGGVAANWSANWRSGTVNYVDVTGTQIRDADVQCLSAFGNLSILKLSDTRISDAGLAHLKCLGALQHLYLERTRITDAGLEHLQGLTGLKALLLDGTQVTDAGLEHLRGLASLQWLSLHGTQVTDAGLQSLKNLTSLSYLGLRHTLVTDAGLEYLQVVPSLSSLDLAGTQVTSSGLKHLKRVTGLIHLDFTDCEVTDAGLAHLKGLTNLQSLQLRGTQVTDAGLVYLKGLSNLGWLDLTDTRVTEAGAEEFRQALPDCTVHR